LRWGIECWHQVLKGVCRVERRQMKTAQALERALALDMIIASRVLLLSRLGKEHPELPAELGYSAEELAVLEIKKNRECPVSRHEAPHDAPSQCADGDAGRILGTRM
jgi:hypothetical protein